MKDGSRLLWFPSLGRLSRHFVVMSCFYQNLNFDCQLYFFCFERLSRFEFFSLNRSSFQVNGTKSNIHINDLRPSGQGGIPVHYERRFKAPVVVFP